MLVLLSPSKKLDEKSDFPKDGLTQPHFIENAVELVDVLKTLQPEDLTNLMGLSEKLANLNYERNQAFSVPFTADNARPALFLFKGDVYDKMDVADYTADELTFAQKHIRILSGQYGLLKPMDLMQPYRLEMGTKLANPKGKDLYAYWGQDLSDNINADAGGDVVINLASNEYFKAASAKHINKRIITINFKQLKNGQLKTIGLMAKRARGMMANYIIHNSITNPEEIKNFAEGGYQFIPDSSDDKVWTFIMDMDV